MSGGEPNGEPKRYPCPAADASVKRRGHGEDAIYFAADKNRYIGAISVGFGPDGKRLRRKVSGKTKQEVRDKLKALHAELNAGLQPSAGYTIQATVDDWLEHGLPGCSARTVQLDRDGINAHGPNVGPGMASGLTAPCDICASADALVDALVAETHLMCDLAASVDLRR